MGKITGKIIAIWSVILEFLLVEDQVCNEPASSV